MTDWKTVYATPAGQPAELDTTSSSFVVYQRRNIRQVDNNLFQYEERKLTREEYKDILISDTYATKTELNVISDTYVTKTALSTGLNSKLDSDATAAKAFKDSSGNVISDTYVTKTELLNLQLSGGGFSPIVLVTSVNAETLSVSNGTTTLTAAFVNKTAFINLPSFGNWTVTVSKDERSRSLNLDVDTVKLYEFTLDLPVRYGYRISKTEADPDARVEYLYDAVGMTPAHMVFDTDPETAGTDSDTSYFDYGSWQSVWFIADNKPCMLNPDGTVAYYLDSNDYTKKIDGTASDATNTDTALYAMVQFPLVWIYRYEDDDYLYEIVSNVQWDDNYKAYAHTNYQGVIKPYFYLSPDSCTNTDPFKSILGQNDGGSNLTTEQMFQRATAIGNGWHLISWSQVQLLRSFMMLISKSTDSSHFANNFIYSNASLTSGQFSRNKIFHCWFDCPRISGANSSDYNIYVKMTPVGGYRPNDVNGYVQLNYISTKGSGLFIKEMTCNQYGMCPKTLGGSSSTFFDNYRITIKESFNTMQYLYFQIYLFWNGTIAHSTFRCSLSYV